MAKGLARFTGAQVLEELAELMGSFQSMYDGFKERAAAVRRLLAQPEVGFVVVSSASARSVDEALSFRDRLRHEGMPVAAVVANRVTPALWSPARGAEQPHPLPGGDALSAALAAKGLTGAGDLGERLARTLAENELQARIDAGEAERFFGGDPAAHLTLLRLERDVHDLPGLAQLAARL